MPKTNLDYWLALKLVPRLAVHKKLALVKQHGLAALFKSNKIISTLNLTTRQLSAFCHPDWPKIEKIIALSLACNSKIICFDEHQYPRLLQEIHDPPLVIFTQGNTSLLNKDQIAIVGSRSATINGRDIACKLAEELTQQGLVITSGMALGVDAAAHRGALRGNGNTIAVVATGLNKVYPSRHKQLSQDILQAGGLIVSEFVPGTLPKAGHFPKRNRIISGLCQGVLVVEAEIRSGSLITARCALEQGRDVYAVPGSINNPLAKGCHWLIKQGAKLVEECADIVEELTVSTVQLKTPTNQENNYQQDLFNDPLLASVDYEVTPIDIVVSRTKLPTEVVLTRLTMLELKGHVVAVPGGYIRLNRG
ncbi:MAG: DNA-processing protein DprA [Colwellia sp.]|nr:DNA-processing protein DprA [Colwellia sp.]